LIDLFSTKKTFIFTFTYKNGSLLKSKIRMSEKGLFFVFFLYCLPCLSQPIDSLRIANNDTMRVMITAFGQYRAEANALPAIRSLQGADLDRSNKTSFVQSLNTLPGVRMEERSPGSYRISMRGSSLRSPFGVRNIKVYYNQIPLTDPGGNTYFNQLPINAVSSIEVAKGPASSLYGAGTGGVILLNSLTPWQKGIQTEVFGGSYGLFGLMGTVNWNTGQKKQSLNISHTQQDSYRQQSRMRRNTIAYSGELILKKQYQLKLHTLLTDLYYQTPGGLTLNEFNANPSQARPRAGTQPSAAENKAAIFQKNALIGLEQEIIINEKWKNLTTFYAAFASIKNPSIRNYEERSEPHTGGRSVFTYTHKYQKNIILWMGGIEGQYGRFRTQVFRNRNGTKGDKQTDDLLSFSTANAFSQIHWEFDEKIDLTAGISTFYNKVTIDRQYPSPSFKQQRRFSNEWAPRVSMIYRPSSVFQFNALVSRGYSPPTVSELLPSTSVISLNLQAESGWNFEGGVRLQSKNNQWQTNLNYFNFALQDALVQRRDSTGADFYTNAGNTLQQGIEWSGQYLKSWQKPKGIEVLQIKSAYTFSDFSYKNFRQNNADFSGNSLPSVPAHSLSLTVDLQWKSSFNFQSTLYTASDIWLNDSNAEKAKAYQLLGVRATYGKNLKCYFGIDNLLNQDYSLGNDINAFGGRFYNAAPRINFYSGLRIVLKN
jgi:iron complex outermembrane receptor protein